MSLIIHIENLPEEGIEIKEDLDRSWLSNIPEYTRENDLGYVKDRINISGSLSKEGNSLHLRGSVNLVLHTFCSRCGEEMEYPLVSGLDLVLMPGKERISENDLSPEDFNHLYCPGPELDLTPYFQEQIALEIPLQFSCRPDCKGICPGCGCNLNNETCRCVKEEGDSRLQVLRQLKLSK